MHLQGDIGVFQQFDPAVRHAGKLAGMIVKADMNNVSKLGRIADVGFAVMVRVLKFYITVYFKFLVPRQ